MRPFLTLNLQAANRRAYWMILLSAFTTPLMLSAVNVALPAIGRDLNMSAVLLSWVPMAYLMASAMFVLLFGRLADMYGRRRLFLGGTVLVILSSLAAAQTNSGEMLVVCRFVQGTSVAMLYATQVAIVSSIVPPAQRGQAIGRVISTLYLGLGTGPLLGGVLIDWFGWRSSFLFYIPLALLVLYIGLCRLDLEWKAEHRGGLDPYGSLIYMLTIVLLTTGVSLLPGPTGLILCALGVACLFGFVRVEKLVQHPIVDVRLMFANRVFTHSCLASFVMYTATFANVVLISLYLQYLQGLSAAQAGLIMVTQPLLMALSASFSGQLSDRIEPKWLASAGIAITAGGLVLLASVDATTPLALVVLALSLTGLGFGLFSSPNTNAIMGTVDKARLGVAAGINSTMRILGQLSSMVVVSVVMSGMLGSAVITADNYPLLEQVVSTTFTITALLCLPGLILSLNRGRMHEQA